MPTAKFWDGSAWVTLPWAGPNDIVPIEAWRTVGAAGEPAFANSWGALNASFPPQFRKRPDGTVELRGILNSGGAAATAAFTLPEGYRPNSISEQYFSTAASATPISALVYVSPNGTVVPYTKGTNWTGLDSIRFSTDQSTFPVGPQGPAGPSTPIPVVAALPSSPVNGQEVYYQDATMASSGLLWHLRYRSLQSDGVTPNPSAYKWEVLGGSPLYSEVATQETKGATVNVYGDLATIGPSIALPLPGDYDVMHGFQGNDNNDGRQPLMSYAIGATAAIDADATYHDNAQTLPRSEVDVRSRRRTGMAAVTLTAKYRSNSSGGSPIFWNRWMKAMPIRVG